MSKWMAVAALGVAMICVCGCDSMKKKDASTTQPQKMSTSGGEKCTACDVSKAK